MISWIFMNICCAFDTNVAPWRDELIEIGTGTDTLPDRCCNCVLLLFSPWEGSGSLMEVIMVGSQLQGGKKGQIWKINVILLRDRRMDPVWFRAQPCFTSWCMTIETGWRATYDKVKRTINDCSKRANAWSEFFLNKARWGRLPLYLFTSTWFTLEMESCSQSPGFTLPNILQILAWEKQPWRGIKHNRIRNKIS